MTMACRGEDSQPDVSVRSEASLTSSTRISSDEIDRVRAAFSAENFEIQNGLFKIFRVEDCDCLPTCYVNNPSSPYGILEVPLAPGEPDPDPEGRYTIDTDMRLGYRLRADEALIYLGTTPPPCRYYSYTAYVFSRYNTRRVRKENPPYDDRIEVFGSLGDSLNQLVIKTAAGPGENSFGKRMAMIVTGNRNTEQSALKALAAAGFPASMVNTLVIPTLKANGRTPLARMGYDNKSDVFTVLARIADPDTVIAGTPTYEWLQDPGATVMRVRPVTPQPAAPIPFPPLRLQGTGDVEDQKIVQRLVDGVVTHYGRRACVVRRAIPVPWEDGYIGIERLIPCFADCRDTPYMISFAMLGPPPEKLIVVGYNHELSGKASYANVTVTRLSGLTAFNSIVMDQLTGSADVYLPGDPDAAKVWQVAFTRAPSDDPYTFEVTEEQAPLNEPLMIVVRAYLQPATGTSAKALPLAESEIAFPRLIKVTPQIIPRRDDTLMHKAQ